MAKDSRFSSHWRLSSKHRYYLTSISLTFFNLKKKFRKAGIWTRDSRDWKQTCSPLCYAMPKINPYSLSGATFFSARATIWAANKIRREICAKKVFETKSLSTQRGNKTSRRCHLLPSSEISVTLVSTWSAFEAMMLEPRQMDCRLLWQVPCLAKWTIKETFMLCPSAWVAMV